MFTTVLAAARRRILEGVLSWPFPRPAARALVERDGEYLFVAVEMDWGRRWILPGGGVESGESPREAVAREVREETGLAVTVGDPVDAFAFESSLDPTSPRCFAVPTRTERSPSVRTPTRNPSSRRAGCRPTRWGTSQFRRNSRRSSSGAADQGVEDTWRTQRLAV